MSDRTLVRVTTDPLDPAEATRFVAHRGAGGACVFVGTVRDHSDAGTVTGVEYEAWDERALRSMESIADEILEKWPARRVALLHRTGDLAIGEVSVVVGCSAPHRGDAFDACRHGIERIKEEVPVWKKEHLTTGEAHWVRGS